MTQEHEIEILIKTNHDEQDLLFAMSFDPFEFAPGEMLTEGQWRALASMCFGETWQLENGLPDQHHKELDEQATKARVISLRTLGYKIYYALEERKP